MGQAQPFLFKGPLSQKNERMGLSCSNGPTLKCRINRGFYRFGDTILELNIINHKLMAKTEVLDLRASTFCHDFQILRMEIL